MSITGSPKLIHADTVDQLDLLVSEMNRQFLHDVPSVKKLAMFPPIYSVELEKYLSLATTVDKMHEHAHVYFYMKTRNHIVSQLAIEKERERSIGFLTIDDPRTHKFRFVTGEVEMQHTGIETEFRYLALVFPLDDQAAVESEHAFPISILFHDLSDDTGVMIGFRSIKDFSELKSGVVPEVSSRRTDWLCQRLFDRTCEDFKNNLTSEMAYEIWEEMKALIQVGEREAASVLADDFGQEQD